uniref:Cleavage and polyadenylation specificity factor subunit 2 n=1 Tax=Kwoniella pini CBS 10737 TaxID=1296096 RepID=A0A1B9I7N7_9TREE|nr:cleavage and polyadenylation specificity factor subunit 2 [Kwoniella pini CBS 10737]OCF51461.1 cleavage and polyadenylation specificity factor subunit 2 [Kwoniella pini CBS 10737]
MITLTPLSSSASASSSSEPICYLLELDEARILLDLGQRDYRSSASQKSWEYEEKVRELAPTLSLVLLSHSPTTYLSLYPYARARWGLTCPVYATQPTVEMGRVVCLAEVESWRSERPFVPTIEEVHEAFDWIKAIRYNQPLHLGGDLSHLLLTPFPSGHTLGGTLFKIRSPTSGTILYAVGINHTSERHLDGMVGEGVLRPDLLIVEGGRSEVVNPKRRDRETAILDVVTSTLESNHSVLLPSDPSPRLLELLVLLDQHWTFKLNPANKRRQTNQNDPWPYPLCLVSRTGQDMVAFARSLIEWMGGRNAGAALGSEYGALDFRHVQFFLTPSDLLQAYPLMRPKLVLAIPPTMSHGPSRFLFTTMASTEGNVILLTSPGEDTTLARELYDTWEAQQDETGKWAHGKIGKLGAAKAQLKLEMDSKVPLVGAELEAHLEAERLAKEREAAHQAALDRSKRMLEADDLDSESESEESGDEDDADGIIVAKRLRDENANAFAGDGEDVNRTMSFDIYVKGQQTRINRGYQKDGEMTRFRMFPFLERRGRKIDAYGEGLDIGQWVRKGREIEEEGETEEVREKKRLKEEEEEKQKVKPEPPSKYISETLQLDLKASIFFVDMEGLHDGQSIKTIISDLQPRKLIIVRSQPDITSSLVKYLNSTAGVTQDIYIPGTDEQIRIGEHVQSYSITLGDSISAGLAKKWSKFEGYEVAMIDGKIAFAPGSTVPVLEASELVKPLPIEATIEEEPENKAASGEVSEGDVEMTTEPAKEATDDTVQDEQVNVKIEPETEVIKEDIKPDLEQLESLRKTKTKGYEIPKLSIPSSLLIGTLRLNSLKNHLTNLKPLSIPCEFAGEGILICGPGLQTPENEKVKSGSIISIKKMGENGIVIEGTIGKIYDLVVKAVKSELASVNSA